MRKLLFPVVIFVLTTFWMALQKLVFMGFYGGGYGFADGCRVVWHGLGLDITIAGYFTVLPILLTPVLAWLPRAERALKIVLNVYFVLVSILAAAAFAGNLALYEYWGFPMDASVFIYLTDPAEAAASVTFWGIVWPLAIFAFYVAGMGWSYRVLIEKFFCRGGRRVTASLLLVLMFGLNFIAIRGGVTVATANVSRAYFSSEMRLNHAAVNPLFSVLSSAIDSGNDDYAAAYPFFEEEERERIFGEISAPESTPTETLLNTERPNIVLILLESFGRTVTDTGAAPNLLRLKEEGIWFENFYANSFRTDRGEVAVLSGFPAQTALSIMKLPRQSASLPSIAGSLGEAGYNSLFVYGGDLNFTNQASYMYATGWKNLLWQRDMHLDAPTSKWGYADDAVGVLFGDKVLEMSRGKIPFIAGWLTLSSHEPFEVPTHTFDDKILNAMHFTDAAVGALVERLRTSPAWDDTLIVLVADHGYAYPAGMAYNAPERHHIPMLWLGGAVARPRVVETYGSQVDLCATLLAQLRLPHAEYAYSKDLFDPTVPHFGYYTFSDGFGIVDQTGATLYDHTSARTLVEASPQHVQWGKALLQTTYVDISAR